MNNIENDVFSFYGGTNMEPQLPNNVVPEQNNMNVQNEISQPPAFNNTNESNLFEVSIEQPIEQNTEFAISSIPNEQSNIEIKPEVPVNETLELSIIENVEPQVNALTNELPVNQPEVEQNVTLPELEVQSEPVTPLVENNNPAFAESTIFNETVNFDNNSFSNEVVPQIEHTEQVNDMFPTTTIEQPQNIVEEVMEPSFQSFVPETLPEPEVQSEMVTPVVENNIEPVIVQETTMIPERTGVITMSDTSSEELNKMVEYKEPEVIETTDIKSLFDRVGVNVKEASDIFRKNSEMKEKLDSRFEELKKLQSEVQKTKKSQYDEIESYKNEVLEKLNGKKEEIEKRLIKLKEYQSSLEKEKEKFEAYKKAQKAEIEKVQREVQEAYDVRREELNHIEDILRKQKDAIDEERNQLSLDRIQYEADKNELANNLLKFNEIVDSFTNGMDKIGKE